MSDHGVLNTSTADCTLMSIGASQSTGCSSPRITCRPLKRSASNASLPTPPRTRRYRRCSIGSAPCDEADRATVISINDIGSIQGRCSQMEEPDVEEGFWLGQEGIRWDRKPDSSLNGKAPPHPCSPELTPQLGSTNAALSLASPPPSPQGPATNANVDSALVSESPRYIQDGVVRNPSSPLWDLADNPFLDNGPSHSVDNAPGNCAALEEKPSLVFVFRGNRVQYANPYYVPKDLSSSSASCSRARNKLGSDLPLGHPEYSPDISCPPRRLFTKRDRMAFPHAYVADEEPDDDFSLGSCINLSRRLFDPLQGQ